MTFGRRAGEADDDATLHQTDDATAGSQTLQGVEELLEEDDDSDGNGGGDDVSDDGGGGDVSDGVVAADDETAAAPPPLEDLEEGDDMDALEAALAGLREMPPSSPPGEMVSGGGD